MLRRMRHLLLLLALLAACASPPRAPAKKFAMRSYYMAVLRRGPAWIAADTPERKQLLAGHMKTIRRLAADGRLLIAGPFDLPAPSDAAPEAAPRDTLVGVFLFDVPTQAEAEALVRTDPTIAAGHFAAQVLPWYGPRGLTYDGRDEERAKWGAP